MTAIDRRQAKEPIEKEIERQLAYIKEYEGDRDTQDVHRYAICVLREVAAALDAPPALDPSAPPAEGKERPSQEKTTGAGNSPTPVADQEFPVQN